MEDVMDAVRAQARQGPGRHASCGHRPLGRTTVVRGARGDGARRVAAQDRCRPGTTGRLRSSDRERCRSRRDVRRRDVRRLELRAAPRRRRSVAHPGGHSRRHAVVADRPVVEPGVDRRVHGAVRVLRRHPDPGDGGRTDTRLAVGRRDRGAGRRPVRRAPIAAAGGPARPRR